MRTVTRGEMQEIDRKAITEYGIPGIILMENAGIRTTDAALGMIKDKDEKRVVIFSGSGNNGGDGWVVARHLINNGVYVTTFLVGDEGNLREEARINLSILENMGQKIFKIEKAGDGERLGIGETLKEAHLVIDAIFGIGIKGEVREPARSIIRLINSVDTPVLSVDIPSGLDADTGLPLGEAIKADLTVTMGIAKKGLLNGDGPRYHTLRVLPLALPPAVFHRTGTASPYTGRLIVADIGLPREI